MGVGSPSYFYCSIPEKLSGIAFLSYRAACDLTLLKIINTLGKLGVIHLYFSRFPTTASCFGEQWLSAVWWWCFLVLGLFGFGLGFVCVVGWVFLVVVGGLIWCGILFRFYFRFFVSLVGLFLSSNHVKFLLSR